MVSPRQNLANALSEAGVEFPPSATAQQLRNLLRSVVGTDEGAASFAPEDAADADSDGAVNNGTDALNSSIPFDCTAAAAYNQTTTTTDADSDTAVAAIGTTAATTNTAGETNKDQRDTLALRDLDEEVIALKKRIEILTLRKRVEELECRVPKENKRRLDFGDIEHALPKFNGDDVSYSVLHFLRDFEEIMNTSGADDSFKLLALRRSLKGTARVFLSTTTALNYDSLKTALTAEFGKAITQQEIYRMLAQPNESMNIPVILGRDFLRIFNIELRNGIKKYSKEKLLEIRDRSKSYASVTTQPVIGSDIHPAATMPKHSGDELHQSKPNSYSIPSELPDIFNIDISRKADDVDIGPKLGKHQRDVLKRLIDDTYFSNSVKAEPSNYEMKIHLTSDVPFHCAPRRLSYAERSQVQAIIDELRQDGIIRPSNSPYASAIVLVRKKNGKIRLCVDYRALNKLTVRDNYPLPLIDDCIDYLENKKFLSVLDLKSGFYQVQMAPESIKLTAFVTPNGQYEYLKMPFGLKNSPAVFQRFINNVFRDMIDDRKIIIYMDDILVATEKFKEHENLLQAVLERLALRDLELNLNKCKFGYEEIDYLGYTVTHTGIRPNDSHIKSIQNFPIPTNPKQLQSCIGLFSYFRRFEPSFSQIAKPLQNLLRRNSAFSFDEKCLDAFNELKSRLVKGPVLAIYSPERETELHCDASSIGFGSVLLQRQDDKKFHPVSYFSKTASSAEAKYHSFELEALSIIYALRRFRPYLEGIPFTIVTDCNSLTMTLEKKQLNPRIARWALEFENYNYKIKHRRGASMGHVDALSRREIAHIINADDVEFQLQVAQERDKAIESIRNRLENEHLNHYVLVDGLVYREMANG
ncbi:uncharacterized protein LOC129237061 [Anastrepha obliqua]|uniref:uncharacterized protein LOC129237061 n=1 Tax=Anastrepha obliqua TaxID=95512 RepID=UPI0024097694|nr:uncharacterized protein LOC129237061 [Anastrepha obliqua]